MEEEIIRQFRAAFLNIEEEIGSVIIGQKELIRGVLTAMIAGGNVLLEGLPGLGKTQLVKTIGKVLELEFSRIQFTPDLMPADVTGTMVMTNNVDGGIGMEFRKGPIFSNIVLADEINRATPKTQSALLEAMQEHTVTSGNETYPLPEPFFVLATQNPLESEGTYPLPEAQMDRFLFKLNVTFPNKAELLQIVSATTTGLPQEAKKVCNQEKLIQMRQVAREVPVATSVAEYIMDIVLKSHPDYIEAPALVKKYVRFGASPRGAQGIMMTAKVYALMAGRYNVAYDDVKAVAKGALRHRIFLNFEGMADGVTVDEIIEALLV
ncbi:MoxR family ATPase [Anaerotignum sp.]|uniref:AAA family ATPase n=1 Tax=Anaerotignum sp. TaxID=2039241 RepID=UPI00332A7F8B